MTTTAYNTLRRTASRGQLEPVGTLWPNGEFGITWKHGGHRETVELDSEGIQKLVGLTGQPLPVGMPVGEEGAQRLDLTNVPNSHSEKKRAPRGSNGLTSHGARMVRNGVGLLEKRHGKSCLTFLTLTLPPLPQEQAEESNIQWAEMVRQFQQWLKRRIESKEHPFLLVGVTEIQTGRAESTGHRWLHYHAVFLGREKKGAWFVTPAEVRTAWTRIVRSRIPGFEGVCPGENLQRIKKSAERYLSKYMSKGSSVEGSGVLPSSWWNMSSRLRGTLLPMVGRGAVTGEWLQLLVDGHMREPSDCFVWLYPVVLMGEDGCGFLVGFTGRLSPQSMPMQEYYVCRAGS